MKSGNDINKLNNNNNSLETIPEEDLPRISQLIPKSPETRKREQEFSQFYEDLLTSDKRIEVFYEMLIVNRNLKRISWPDKYGMHAVGNYTNNYAN